MDELQLSLAIEMALRLSRTVSPGTLATALEEHCKGLLSEQMRRAVAAIVVDKELSVQAPDYEEAGLALETFLPRIAAALQCIADTLRSRRNRFTNTGPG